VNMNDPRDLSIAELPPVLATIAHEIGIGAALKLAQEWGGVDISVPARMTSDHPIARLIGLEAGLKLHRLIVERGLGDGVRRLEIPRGHYIGSRALRIEIREAVAGGMPKRQAALKFGVTNRAVRKICNGVYERDERQPKLL